MPIDGTYRTWIQRITQVRNFVWLTAGIFHSRSVRLSRFLVNPAMDVRAVGTNRLRRNGWERNSNELARSALVMVINC